MDREEQIAMACGFQTIAEARQKMGADFDRFVRGDIVKDITPQIHRIVDRMKSIKWPLTIDTTAEVVPDEPRQIGAGDD